MWTLSLQGTLAGPLETGRLDILEVPFDGIAVVPLLIVSEGLLIVDGGDEVEAVTRVVKFWVQGSLLRRTVIVTAGRLTVTVTCGGHDPALLEL